MKEKSLALKIFQCQLNLSLEKQLDLVKMKINLIYFHRALEKAKNIF